MLWDLAMLKMPLRILKEKLFLYHHISCLPENSVANQMMTIQETFCFPSLRNEISDFLSQFEVVDVKKYSKSKWKDFVNKSISELNRIQLLDDIKSYKKLDFWELACEEYKIKDYFLHLNLDNARIFFRARAKTVTSCSTHFFSDEANIKSMFEC